MKQQSYEDATAAMKKAIELDPENIDFHVRRSDLLYLSQEDDSEALREINLAISRIDYPRADYFCKKAAILERLKRYPEAQTCVDKGIAIKISKMKAGSKKYDKTILAFFYNERASIMNNMNRWKEAENDLTTALKLDPDSPDLWIHRAQISTKTKNWAQVILDCENIIKLKFRNTPLLRRRETYLLLGDAYANQRNYSKATSTYIIALRECPDDRLILTAAQKYYTSIGDKKNAESVKKRLQSLDEDFVPFK